MWTFLCDLSGFLSKFFIAPGFFSAKYPSAIITNPPPENNIVVFSGTIYGCVLTLTVWAVHTPKPRLSILGVQGFGPCNRTPKNTPAKNAITRIANHIIHSMLLPPFPIRHNHAFPTPYLQPAPQVSFRCISPLSLSPSSKAGIFFHSSRHFFSNASTLSIFCANCSRLVSFCIGYLKQRARLPLKNLHLYLSPWIILVVV